MIEENWNDENIFIFFVDFRFEITEDLIARFAPYGFQDDLQALMNDHEHTRKYSQFGGFFKKDGSRDFHSVSPVDGNMHYGLKGAFLFFYKNNKDHLLKIFKVVIKI